MQEFRASLILDSEETRSNRRLSDWSNLDVVTQKSSCDLGRPIRLVGMHRQFTSTGIPLHNEPYIKTKTKLNAKFRRLILAQTLSVNPSLGGDQHSKITVWKVLKENRNDTIKVFHDSPVRVYGDHNADILDLSWSKGNFLISCSLDKTARLWHVSQADCLCIFRHVDVVTSVKFHPQSDIFFVSGSVDSKIRLWNIQEKKVIFWNMIPQERAVTAIGFSMDGRIVCAGTNTGDVFFFDLDELRYNTEVLVKNRRQKYGKKVTGVEPMPNLPTGEERMLITTNDSRVWMLNMKDMSVIYKYKGIQNPKLQIKASFSDDGRSIISGSENGRIYLWSTDQVTYFPFPNMYDNRLRSAILSNTRDYTMKHENDENHFEGQLQGMFGLLKRGERKLMRKMGGFHESFIAHDQTATVGVFAPTKTKQILARAGGDTILDCTPVYVYKQEIVDSNDDDSCTYGNEKCITNYTLEEALPEEKLLYNYPNSHIIVSADSHGIIKVWRMDSGVYEDKEASNTKTEYRNCGKPKKKFIFF